MRGEIDKLQKKEFSLKEENVNKQGIIEDLHKKNIELKNKLDLIKNQSDKNNTEKSSNTINNIENLFSNKVKVLEEELKEMKDIYNHNLEKLNKKQARKSVFSETNILYFEFEK